MMRTMLLAGLLAVTAAPMPALAFLASQSSNLDYCRQPDRLGKVTTPDDSRFIECRTETTLRILNGSGLTQAQRDDLLTGKLAFDAALLLLGASSN